MNLKDKISQLSTKEKIEYFWEYYKIHAIAVIFTVTAVIYSIYVFSTKTEDISHGFMINGACLTSPSVIAEDYLDYANITDEKKSIMVDTSLYLDLDANDMTSMEATIKINTLIPAKQIDYMIATKEIIQHYSSNNFFLSLDDVLELKEFDYISDQILTIDFTLEDHYYQGEHPMAINISDSPKLAEWGAYTEEDAYIAFIGNSERLEGAVDFLNYLYTSG